MKLWIARCLRKAANRLDPNNPQFVDGVINLRGIEIARITPDMIQSERPRPLR